MHLSCYDTDTSFHFVRHASRFTLLEPSVKCSGAQWNLQKLGLAPCFVVTTSDQKYFLNSFLRCVHSCLPDNFPYDSELLLWIQFLVSYIMIITCHCASLNDVKTQIGFLQRNVMARLRTKYIIVHSEKRH